MLHGASTQVTIQHSSKIEGNPGPNLLLPTEATVLHPSQQNCSSNGEFLKVNTGSGSCQNSSTISACFLLVHGDLSWRTADKVVSVQKKGEGS